jgi:Protein of unknown function (DUF2786)/SprT-like family
MRTADGPRPSSDSSPPFPSPPHPASGPTRSEAGSAAGPQSPPGAPTPTLRLTAELERALLLQLAAAWHEVNQNHFRGRLRKPVFSLSDTERRLGVWDSAARSIALSRTLVLERPWGVVREVLKHEMAHQFVDEVLEIRGQTAHGPAFESVCRERGFDALANGLPVVDSQAGGDGGTARSAERSENLTLRRIARLLALAESPNAHEAEAAMKVAQRLMLQHNIAGAVAAAREGYTFRQLGEPSGRIHAAEHVLAGILSRHFFVEAIWVSSFLVREGRGGRVLELCGTRSNLDVAAYVHGFLLETAERLWLAHRRARGLRGNAERRRFRLGVMIGFNEKLKSGAEENRREGLIWVGDPALASYLANRYPRRTSGAGIGIRATESYEEGRRAGRTIVLHRPVPGSPVPEARGRSLPPRG